MSVLKYITLSQLRTMAAAWGQRSNKIESDIDAIEANLESMVANTKVVFTKTGNTDIAGFGDVDVYSYKIIKDGATITENLIPVLIQAQARGDDVFGIITDESGTELTQWMNFSGVTNYGFLFTIQQFDTTATVQNVYGIYLNSNYCIGSSLPMANYQNATTSAAGLMSASDKEKLDGITLQSLTGLINELIDDALTNADASEVEY